MAAAGTEVSLFHTTRMFPKRSKELLDGGSLYWVVKGNIQARQRLTEIRPIVDSEGIRRCKLMLDSEIIATEWQPKRAFQGWRYLSTQDAPRDLPEGRQDEEPLPPELSKALSAIGVR